MACEVGFLLAISCSPAGLAGGTFSPSPLPADTLMLMGIRCRPCQSWQRLLTNRRGGGDCVCGKVLTKTVIYAIIKNVKMEKHPWPVLLEGQRNGLDPGYHCLCCYWPWDVYFNYLRRSLPGLGPWKKVHKMCLKASLILAERNSNGSRSVSSSFPPSTAAFPPCSTPL